MLTPYQKDLVAAGVTILCAGFVYALAWQLPDGAATYPRLLCFAMAILGVLLGVSAWLSNRQTKPATAKTIPQAEKPTSNWLLLVPAALVLVAAMFILTVPWVGFDIGLIGVMFAAALIVDRTEALRKLYLIILVPTVLILLFRFGVGLRIPLTIDRFF
ncbi:MAG: tripartite tricarboxylate transporter TctB family protein [Marinosulfonomonas sp.]|nr:tripartite tricarboxylate transporter TctB family protein [Marinosulfonomonas sp.]